MKIKTSELIGSALDWVVAKCEGSQVDIPSWATTPWVRCTDPSGAQYVCPKYSTDWAQGGPIIEREGIWVSDPTGDCMHPQQWGALVKGSAHDTRGPTPLIAAMRCFVSHKLGDEVDVPEELLK